jgi:hypothetical protein
MRSTGAHDNDFTAPVYQALALLQALARNEMLETLGIIRPLEQGELRLDCMAIERTAATLLELVAQPADNGVSVAMIHVRDLGKKVEALLLRLRCGWRGGFRGMLVRGAPTDVCWPLITMRAAVRRR